MMRSPPRPTLFPSTPLSRSPGQSSHRPRPQRLTAMKPPISRILAVTVVFLAGVASPAPAQVVEIENLQTRSEEHTSELQSRQYLVCRLLLEKKKHDNCSYAV